MKLNGLKQIIRMASLEELVAKVTKMEKIVESLQKALEAEIELRQRLEVQRHTYEEGVTSNHEKRLEAIEDWIEIHGVNHCMDEYEEESQGYSEESSSTKWLRSNRNNRQDVIDSGSRCSVQVALDEEESLHDGELWNPESIPRMPQTVDSSCHRRTSEWIQVAAEKEAKKQKEQIDLRGETSRGVKRRRRKSPNVNGCRDEEKRGPGKCYKCSKHSRRDCEICGKLVCMDHRIATIRCCDYDPVLQDCYLSNKPIVRLPKKNGVGRCVNCDRGSRRKLSRTSCQKCDRFICADHQRKQIVCLEHRREVPGAPTATT